MTTTITITLTLEADNATEEQIAKGVADTLDALVDRAVAFAATETGEEIALMGWERA